MEDSAAPSLPWPLPPGEGGDTTSFPAFLDFLNEDLLGGSRDLLDSGTLAAAAAASSAQAAASHGRPKRGRFEVALDAAGADVCEGAADSDDDLSDDAGEDGEGRGRGSSQLVRPTGKKSAAAAANKANREKARREKLNDKFIELSRLVDPGSEPKTDKLSILAEAIRFVQQVHLENCQLKQLNKFLEEKVGTLEKERGQLLYQQMYPQPAAGYVSQHQQQQQVQMHPPGPSLACSIPVALAPAMQAGGVMLPPSVQAQQQPLLQPQQQQQTALPQQQQEQQQQQQQLLPSQTVHAKQETCLNNPQQPPVLSSSSAGATPATAAATAAHLHAQHAAALQLQHAAAAAAAASQVPFLQGKPIMAVQPSGMPMPVPYWPSMLPANMMDSTQDSLLRPPAA